MDFENGWKQICNFLYFPTQSQRFIQNEKFSPITFLEFNATVNKKIIEYEKSDQTKKKNKIKIGFCFLFAL